MRDTVRLNIAILKLTECELRKMLSRTVRRGDYSDRGQYEEAVDRLYEQQTHYIDIGEEDGN